MLLQLLSEEQILKSYKTVWKFNFLRNSSCYCMLLLSLHSSRVTRWVGLPQLGQRRSHLLQRGMLPKQSTTRVAGKLNMCCQAIRGARDRCVSVMQSYLWQVDLLSRLNRIEPIEQQTNIMDMQFSGWNGILLVLWSLLNLYPWEWTCQNSRRCRNDSCWFRRVPMCRLQNR